jgi:hypothetical protein
MIWNLTTIYYLLIYFYLEFLAQILLHLLKLSVEGSSKKSSGVYADNFTKLNRVVLIPQLGHNNEKARG